MTSQLVIPRKAVVALGFTATPSETKTTTALPRVALAEHLPVADREATRRVVEEALAAGLQELIFITEEGVAVADPLLAQSHPTSRQEVVVPRHGRPTTLEQALCMTRHMIGDEAFVVIAPLSPAVTGRGAVGRLLSLYREEGGNLATVKDAETLKQKGTFAAIESDAAGQYLLQPEILHALAENPSVGLAGALLAQAEAWPVTAVPLVFDQVQSVLKGTVVSTAAEAAE